MPTQGNRASFIPAVAQRLPLSDLIDASRPRCDAPAIALRVEHPTREQFGNHGFIPEDAIPVAFVNGENLVIMRTVGRRANKMQIKISADVSDPNDPEDGIKSVAGSFRKFIELLRFTAVEELDENDYGLY
ncbi:MAG: hypothetical protein ACTHK7_03290 [Aureliella sp.]